MVYMVYMVDTVTTPRNYSRKKQIEDNITNIIIIIVWFCVH